MIARLAALLVLGAMLILVWTTVNMTGHTAIVFSFVGHPMLGLGLILGFYALSRRLRRERSYRPD